MTQFHDCFSDIHSVSPRDIAHLGYTFSIFLNLYYTHISPMLRLYYTHVTYMSQPYYTHVTSILHLY